MKNKTPSPSCCAFVACAAIALAVCSCRPGHWLPQSAPKTSVPEWPSADTAAPAVSVNPDTVFGVVQSLEGNILAEPKDTDWIAPLLAASYDSVCGCFHVVGKGVVNPEHATETARAGQRRAAEKDAKRWSLYLKAWHTGDTRAFGETIEGEVSYSTPLRERVVGDTLFVLLQVPVGSVTVK